MADRFTPGTIAWLRIRVKKPVDLYGAGRQLECEVIGPGGESVDNGYVYVPEGAPIVHSVALTVQERERRGEQKPRRDAW